MSNSYFRFKKFIIHQDQCAMKVTTDACLFGSSLPPAPSEAEKGWTILDIGAGTGLLSLMYAQENAHAFIDAIEIDEKAWVQANQNVDASPWKDRINIIHGDARNYSFGRKYDLIFSNPPFYEDELKSDDRNKNIARHSEALKLQDVLSIIENNLSAEGRFSILLPYKRYTAIKSLFNQSVFELSEIIFVKQSPRHEYFRMVFKGRFNTREGIETKVEEITLTDVTGKYTAEFTKLLHPFYFNL
jgi:tRNA1Val (adenine37-N6)-methyltransferase